MPENHYSPENADPEFDQPDDAEMADAYAALDEDRRQQAALGVRSAGMASSSLDQAALNDDVTADDNEVGKELVEAAVDRLADLYARHERGEPLYGKAGPRVVSELGAIAADVAAAEAEGQDGGFGGQIWRHAEARKR